MGSLVPGWNADIGVPKELVEETYEEPQGYFARLRSHRDIPDTGIQAPPILSLDRVSSPLDMPPPFQHSPTMGARSATLYGSLPRSSTMPLGRRSIGDSTTSTASGATTTTIAEHLLQHAAQYQAAQPQAKYQVTDWSEELVTLRRPHSSLGHSSLARTSLGRTSLGRTSQGHHDEHQDDRSGAWWRSLETGHLNQQLEAEQEEEPRRPGSRGGVERVDSFTPQFVNKPQHLKLDAVEGT